VHVGEPIELPGNARDMFLAVDISGSMNIEDMVLHQRRVDRLTMVKHVLASFIEKRKGDRLGLVVFGSQAHVQAPLTFDLDTVATLMQEIQIGFAGQQTAIGDAIGLVIKRLADNPVEHRTLILLTDGASNAGAIDPVQASRLAAEQGIVIHTIAFGSDKPVSGGFFGFTGRRFSDDIDEQKLKTIADNTGGRFFRARNREELEQIYDTLDQMAKHEQEAAVFRPRQALFYLPLGLSMAAFALLLAFRRYRGGLA
jgi:Ca-activated chloride channel family protein